MTGDRWRDGCPGRRLAGFSLIELMMVVVIMSIGLAVAIPGMTAVINSNRLTSATNELVAAINQARIQAIKRNSNAQFCSSTADDNNIDDLGTACSGTSGGLGAVLWSDGKSTPTITQVLGAITLPSNVVVDNITALRFSGNGLASGAKATGMYSGLVADVYSSNLSQRNHRCIYLATGSIVNVCTVTGDIGACPFDEPSSCSP